MDALRIQLNTILDAVRTYLGIQQQRLSIEEQASSKDQLIRLVNLQEILHKLEILIVAVYCIENIKPSNRADMPANLLKDTILILEKLSKKKIIRSDNT